MILAGVPLDQNVVQYGPFVQSSEEDIYKTFNDYQTHTNGFERARDFQSKIGAEMMGH